MKSLLFAILALCFSGNLVAAEAAPSTADRAAHFARKTPGAKLAKVRPTGSMKPTFDHTAVLVVAPTPYSDLKEGDIVVFKSAGTLMAHRLVSFGAGGWTTKGDALVNPDRARMTPQSYIGRVCEIVKAD